MEIIPKDLATDAVTRSFGYKSEKIIFRSMVSRIVNPMANSPQHFCRRAAIEYPINTIKTEQSRAGLHHAKMSIFNPNQRLSKFTLNHR